MHRKKTVIKDNIKLIGSLLIIVFSLVLNACGGGGEGSVLPKKILEIDLGSNDVAVGGQTTYRGKLIIGDKEEPVQVVCTSSDETVAKVDSDGIIGLGAGEVTITCTFDVLSVSINLKILSPIRVTVSGLVSAAKNLVLQNNANDDLSIDKNGVSEFAEKMLKGDAYHVTVFEQPADPDQVCTVENASGKVDSAAVTNIIVTCAVATEETSMNLSVAVATDKLTLHWEAVINAEQYLVYWADNITPDVIVVTPATVTDTQFILEGDLSESSIYYFLVVAKNSIGSGPVSAEISAKLLPIPPTVLTHTPSANATGISIDLSTVTASFSEALAPTSVNDTSFVVRIQGGDAITGRLSYAPMNTSFALSEPLMYATTYEVALLTDITDVAGNALTENFSWSFTTEPKPDIPMFSMGGSVEGLVADNLVLQLNGAHDLSIDKSANSFEFNQQLDDGSDYLVTIKTQPNDQLCDLINYIGVLTGSPITNISIRCIVKPNPPSGLTVSSAEDSVTLKWETVANADIYHIYRREDANTPVDSDRLTDANGVTDLLFPDTNALQAGKTYQYWISAGNKAGFSAMTKFPSTVQLKPAAPRWARVDSCDNTVYLSWQKISGYHYVIKEGSEVLTEGDINEYTTGELTVGSAHTYRLEVTYLSGIDGGKVVAGAEPATLIVSDALCIPLMITVPVIKDGIKTNVLIPIF